jgi:hypothetical protein
MVAWELRIKGLGERLQGPFLRGRRTGKTTQMCGQDAEDQVSCTTIDFKPRPSARVNSESGTKLCVGKLGAREIVPIGGRGMAE